MAFCSKCGNHLEGNEKFCVKCGADLTTSPPLATPPTAPPPAPPAPPYAAGYPAGGPMPIAVAVPPPPAKRGVWGWLAVIAVLLGSTAFYYNKAQHPDAAACAAVNNNNGGNNGGSGNGGGGNGGGGNNGGGSGGGNTGGGNSGGGNNGGGNGGGGNNGPSLQALLQQQTVDFTWAVTNNVVLVQAKWTNNSTSNFTNGILTCVQYNAGGSQLSSSTNTLLGPVNANTINTYNNVNMGAPSQGLDKLGCSMTNLTLQ